MGAHFLRYALVGAVATAVHYALLVAWVEGWGLPANLGAGVGAVVGAQVAFWGNRQFTFAHPGPAGPAWLRFQGTALFGAALSMAVVAVGGWAGVHYLLAQMVATALGLVVTFLINRAWTFR